MQDFQGLAVAVQVGRGAVVVGPAWAPQCEARGRRPVQHLGGVGVGRPALLDLGGVPHGDGRLELRDRGGVFARPAARRGPAAQAFLDTVAEEHQRGERGDGGVPRVAGEHDSGGGQRERAEQSGEAEGRLVCTGRPRGDGDRRSAGAAAAARDAVERQGTAGPGLTDGVDALHRPEPVRGQDPQQGFAAE